MQTSAAGSMEEMTNVFAVSHVALVCAEPAGGEGGFSQAMSANRP